jgi:hypothetical protein
MPGIRRVDAIPMTFHFEIPIERVRLRLARVLKPTGFWFHWF